LKFIESRDAVGNHVIFTWISSQKHLFVKKSLKIPKR